MSLFWLSDRAWTSIAPHLPHHRTGAHRVDDRRVISGIIHVLKTGSRWCDCPRDYGPFTTVYNRFYRWAREPVWDQIVQIMVQADIITAEESRNGAFVTGDGETMSIRPQARRRPPPATAMAALTSPIPHCGPGAL